MLGLKRKTVRLVSHNKKWKLLFEKEKKILQNRLGDLIVAIQHVGSTSIPGIPAKPIIDISLALRRLKDAKKLIKPLTALNYEWRKTASNSRQWLFVKGFEENRTHYLHIMQYNGAVWKNDLLFRDYLCTHPRSAKQYAELKTKLAEKFAHNREMYTKNKISFIQETIKLAKGVINTCLM